MGNDNTVKWRGLTLQICRSRRPRCGPVLCAPQSACTNTPRDAWQSSTGRIVRSITTPWETRAMTPNWLRERFGSQPADLWTTLPIPTTPQAQPLQKRSINALRTPVNSTRRQQPPHLLVVLGSRAKMIIIFMAARAYRSRSSTGTAECTL